MQRIYDPSAQGYLRAKQVLLILPVGRSTWFAWVQSGKAPKGLKVNGVTVWRATDVHAMVEAPRG